MRRQVHFQMTFFSQNVVAAMHCAASCLGIHGVTLAGTVFKLGAEDVAEMYPASPL